MKPYLHVKLCELLFSADLAREAGLLRVEFHVLFQVGSLREGQLAEIARVGPLARVDMQVLEEVRLLVEESRGIIFLGCAGRVLALEDPVASVSSPSEGEGEEVVLEACRGPVNNGSLHNEGVDARSEAHILICKVPMETYEGFHILCLLPVVGDLLASELAKRKYTPHLLLFLSFPSLWLLLSRHYWFF